MNIMNNYYVYFLIDPIKQLPFYIGKGSGNRYLKHLNESKDDTSNMKKWCKIASIRNLGFEPEIYILKSNLPEDKAYKIEKFCIQFFGRKDIDKNGVLTNICEDGRPPNHTGYTQTDETKKKIGKANSIALKGRTNSAESNAKRSNTLKGRTGRKPSAETLLKISNSLTGMPKPRTKKHQDNMWISRRKNGTDKHDSSSKEKMSQRALNRKKIKCLGCGKEHVSQHARYHINCLD